MAENVSNLVELMKTAYSAENLEEAAQYCNKILEQDISNWQALYFKGTIAAQNSTLSNTRFKESCTYWIKAVENCPENEKNKLKELVQSQCDVFASSLVVLAAHEFARLQNGQGCAQQWTKAIELIKTLEIAEILPDPVTLWQHTVQSMITCINAEFSEVKELYNKATNLKDRAENISFTSEVVGLMKTLGDVLIDDVLTKYTDTAPSKIGCYKQTLKILEWYATETNKIKNQALSQAASSDRSNIRREFKKLIEGMLDVYGETEQAISKLDPEYKTEIEKLKQSFRVQDMLETEEKQNQANEQKLIEEILGHSLLVPANEALDACNMKNRQVFRYGNDAIIFSPACNVLAVQDFTGSIKFISGRYIEDAWWDDGASRHEQGFSLLGGIVGGIASGGSAIGQLYGGLNMGGKDYFSCALVIKVFDPIFKKSKEERVYLLNNKKAGSKEVSDFSFDMGRISQQLQFVANTKSESRDLACAKALKLIDDRVKAEKAEADQKKQAEATQLAEEKQQKEQERNKQKQAQREKNRAFIKKNKIFLVLIAVAIISLVVAFSIYLSNQHEKRLQNADAAVLTYMETVAKEYGATDFSATLQLIADDSLSQYGTIESDSGGDSYCYFIRCGELTEWSPESTYQFITALHETPVTMREANHEFAKELYDEDFKHTIVIYDGSNVYMSEGNSEYSGEYQLNGEIVGYMSAQMIWEDTQSFYANIASGNFTEALEYLNSLSEEYQNKNLLSKDFYIAYAESFAKKENFSSALYELDLYIDLYSTDDEIQQLISEYSVGSAKVYIEQGDYYNAYIILKSFAESGNDEAKTLYEDCLNNGGAIIVYSNLLIDNYDYSSIPDTNIRITEGTTQLIVWEEYSNHLVLQGDSIKLDIESIMGVGDTATDITVTWPNGVKEESTYDLASYEQFYGDPVISVKYDADLHGEGTISIIMTQTATGRILADYSLAARQYS